MQALLVLSASAGFSGVALGAFGAHGLRKRLAHTDDGARRIEWWQTAATYHLVHALAIGLAALVDAQLASRWPIFAAWSFTVGTVLFSGSLYAMALSGLRKLGAITPLGGLAFLAGWVCLLLAGLGG